VDQNKWAIGLLRLHALVSINVLLDTSGSVSSRLVLLGYYDSLQAGL